MRGIFKELALLGFQVKWTKGYPDDTLVVLDTESDSSLVLEPDELREVIVALQQALNEVDPPKYATGGVVTPNWGYYRVNTPPAPYRPHYH